MDTEKTKEENNHVLNGENIQISGNYQGQYHALDKSHLHLLPMPKNKEERKPNITA